MLSSISWNRERFHPSARFPIGIAPSCQWATSLNQVGKQTSKSNTAEITERLFQWVSNRKTPNTWTPLSSIQGAIKKMVIPFKRVNSGEGQTDFLPTYIDLVTKLIKYIPKIEILTPVHSESIAQQLDQVIRQTMIDQNHLYQNQIRLVIVSNNSSIFQDWVQDELIVLNSIIAGQDQYLLKPLNSGSASLANQIEQFLPGFISSKGAIDFAGGNILADEDFVLVGCDELYKTRWRFNNQVSAESIKTLFSHSLNINRDRCLFIGGAPSTPLHFTHQQGMKNWLYLLNYWSGQAQPIFHIDMFISLAGRGDTGKYRALVGLPISETYSPAPISWPKPFANYWVQSLHQLRQALDQTASQLKAAGFEVYRNPLPLTFIDSPLPNKKNTYSRICFLASYNNAIVQRSANQSIVFLPSYAHDYSGETPYGTWINLKEAEEKNRQLWQKLGYEVHFLSDHLPLARLRGGPHCSVKILSRKIH